MFLRKRNKKGFTLIEMMAVIAIIAVLVGILVPVVTSYTNRANAAANAANLRSVKGQVATLLMQGQITYETAEDDSPVKTALSEFKQTLNPGFTNPLDSLLYGIVTTIENAIASITEMTNRYNNTYYSDENGEINIDGTIISAPTSKPVEIEGFKLRKNTPMAVTVSSDAVIVTYGGVSIDVFAIVAENGDTAVLSDYEHTYVDGNSDGNCDICGSNHIDGWTDFEGAGEIVGGIIDGVVSGQTHTCQDTSNPKDCICDIDDCGLKIPCTDDRWGGDNRCNNCNACMGYHDDWWNGDGKCNTCGKTEAEH